VTGSPDVSVVAVSWNTASSLPVALDSMREAIQSHRYETVVVDNGSTDDSLEILGGRDDVRLIALGSNMGFSHAANIGAQHSVGRYLLFLNPDVEADAGTVDSLIDRLSAVPGAFAATPWFCNMDGTPQPFWRRRPDAASLFFCYTHRGRRLDRLLLRGAVMRHHTFADVVSPPSVVELGAVGAAFLLVKRAAFDTAGGFDERYFNFFQDTDLYRKARAGGMKLIGVRDESVRHGLGVTFALLPPDEVHGQFLHAFRQYLEGEPWWRRLAGEAAIRVETFGRANDRATMRRWTRRPLDRPY
jgi:GT2 family glycosyltransferase